MLEERYLYIEIEKNSEKKKKQTRNEIMRPEEVQRKNCLGIINQRERRISQVEGDSDQKRTRTTLIRTFE